MTAIETARPALPINPELPLELEDGTAVTLRHYGATAATVEVPEGVDPVKFYVGAGPWDFALDTGMWCGSQPGEMLRLRNVGTELPAVPAQWKLNAARAARYRSDEERVPWEGAEWHKGEAAELHFAHIVMADGVPMVAFFQSEKHGEAGRLTKMRPGRYLTRYFGTALKNEEIEGLTADVTVQAGALDVRWTQDADEIETIYVNGPRSCMSYPARDYAGPCHPVRVYAGPDLAVAWLGEQDDATARAIVWPERKVYGGVYGDVSRMRRLLEEKGFTKGSFRGARIRLIEADCGEIVMPYLDIADEAAADEAAGVVILGHCGEVETSNTNGVSDSNRATCDRCGDREPADEMSYIEDVGESWCEHCTDHYSNYCEYSHQRIAGNTVEVHRSGSRWTITIAEDSLSDYGAVYVEDRGEYWHEDSVFCCDDCGDHFHVEDRDGRDVGADLCESCADDRAEDGDEGNVTPALPEPDTYAALEAAGQMVLPLPACQWQLWGRDRCGGDEFPVYLHNDLAPSDPAAFLGTHARAEEVKAELERQHPGYNYRIWPANAAVPALALAA